MLAETRTDGVRPSTHVLCGFQTHFGCTGNIQREDKNVYAVTGELQALEHSKESGVTFILRLEAD